MDENEYRQTYRQVNTLPCVFERAVLRRCGICQHAQRLNLAEREAVGCQSSIARPTCQQFLSVMHQKSVFAVRSEQADTPLPFGKEIKIQCGAILGLQTELGLVAPIDIHNALTQAAKVHGSIDTLPYENIVREVNAFKTRRRRKS
jgi:hypothetical protein